MKIVHLSDIHMCPDGHSIYGLDPFKRLNAVIAHINANHGDADACVVTGDLADAGDEASYARLRQCLANLRIPFFLTLGNHDRRKNFKSVFGNEFADPNGFLQSSIRINENNRIVILDTLDESREDGGILCERRMDWLRSELARDTEIPTVVFLHHPPKDLGERYFRDMLLSNGRELLDALRLGNVRHISFGHVHFPVSGRYSCYSFSSSRGTCQTISTVFSERKALMIERSASYELILGDEDCVVVHHVEPVLEAEAIGIDVL
ncbi:phosphodiesterase [Mesorhizobium sp. VK23B]|uniref:Phosphodiesterase n=1 Tax=Mesorhizobium dulcispinae TaxID=3072316 RepID=A0ABU4XBC0_9HYPH|nr:MULTISPECIES: phosphodiesterase [unclassified Mesorhizobium]MDX8465712.1 phosphodiesterase [Mesorhizobium sp. VK23B]MDX8471486.1 phosphodiesterase [Mesorhizobium sp. VK23A]